MNGNAEAFEKLSTGALIGFAVGDALGVPVEFTSREQRKLDPVTGMREFGTQFINQAPKIAKEFGSKLIDELKDLPKKCLEIGKQIVDGIFTGIKNGWGDLKKKVKELIDELLKGVKDGLKIKSPSKVFADEVGAMIPLGIAEGIKNGMASLNAMADGMTMSLVSSAEGMELGGEAYAGYIPETAGASASMIYGLLAEYLPQIASKKTEVDVEFQGGLDRFFRAMQIEAQKNYQLTGVAL